MAYEIPGFKETLVAGVDLSANQYRAVDVNNTGQAVLPAAGGRIAGVQQNKPSTGRAVEVMGSGVSIVEAGAAVTAGDTLQIDATGRVITRTTGVAVGVARETASAAGIRIAVRLSGQLV